MARIIETDEQMKHKRRKNEGFKSSKLFIQMNRGKMVAKSDIITYHLALKAQTVPFCSLYNSVWDNILSIP